MSLIGGGSDCSVNGNALAQFNKHTQQDRSLQQQTANQPVVQNGQGFRNESMMNSREKQHFEQFMNGGSNGGPGAAFQFQPMRQELNRIQQTVQLTPLNNNWTQEFQSHSPSPIAVQPVAKVGSPVLWSGEFQQGKNAPEMAMTHNQQQSTPAMRMGMGNYRPMMGMLMMQRPMQQLQQQQQQQQPVQTDAEQDQQLQVDWDNHFKEVEELTKNVEHAKEGEPVVRAESPDYVIDDKYQATFQEVWDNLNSEAVENDFINQQYEEFKHTQKDPLPADLAQWERDFAKYASTRAHFGVYKFEEKASNQFLDLPADQDPYEIGLQLMENGAKLSEAALAFEAAIQRNENHVDAWLKLGEVQTQNEKEIAGIAALEKCLELHPENSEALMNLAISYINEGYDNAAFATLERWISTKYPQISERAREKNPTISDEDRYSLNKRVTELFMEAARLSPNQANMDADVQMGLGVLFYANEDFDKTIDCFKAALSIQPNDAVLWNRLGASLANSNRSEEAVNAYFKALELKPTFVRARYNLGVSCINIGCYKEAAEHLLSGLAMHQVEGVDANGSTLNHNQSTSLTETLKRAFIAMERRDLVELVKPGMNIDQFRSEFNF